MRLRTIFQKKRLYVEMGGIAFCCGIMNDPQKIAKGKVCRNGRDDFCCGEQSLMMDLFFFVDFFPNKQEMLTNQKKTLILVKSTDCLH